MASPSLWGACGALFSGPSSLWNRIKSHVASSLVDTDANGRSNKWRWGCSLQLHKRTWGSVCSSSCWIWPLTCILLRSDWSWDQKWANTMNLKMLHDPDELRPYKMVPKQRIPKTCRSWRTDWFHVQQRQCRNVKTRRKMSPAVGN